MTDLDVEENPGLQRAAGAMLVMERLRADNPERETLPAPTRVRPTVVQEARLNLSTVPEEEPTLAAVVAAAALAGIEVPPFLDHALGESEVTSSRDSNTSRVGSSFVERDTDSADDLSYVPSQADDDFTFRE